PSPGPARYLVAAFLAFWLCGWAAGWVAAAAQLVRGGPQLFLVGWLGGWTVGGGVAIWVLWSMIGPARPGSIRLEAEWLRYTPGRNSMNPFQHRGWSYWGGPSAPAATLPAEVPRSEIRQFVLDRAGERQRLYFDRGADRLEIGACLREPEREWVYAVLQRWHSPRQPLQLTPVASSVPGTS